MFQESDNDRSFIEKLFQKDIFYFHQLFLKDPCVFYTSFYIKKHDGTSRHIQSPTPLLREYQEKIKFFLEKYSAYLLPQSDSSYAYKKGIGVKDHAERHLHSADFLKVDIKNFFESITTAQIYKIFFKVLYPKENKIAKVLADLCTVNDHLPQGACTSPILSNLFFTQIDVRLEALALSKNLTYTRYADDLFFSGEKIDSRLKSSVMKILKEYQMVINHKKTIYKKEAARKIVTGIDITNGSLRVPKGLRRAFRKNCFDLLKKADSLPLEQLSIEFSAIEGTAGYIWYVEGPFCEGSLFNNYYLLKQKIHDKTN